MMNKLFLLLLLPVISFAQTGGKKFKLNGNLKLNKPISWVYLRYTSRDQLVYDSVQPKNGRFKFEGKIAEPTVATLIVKFTNQTGEENVQLDVMQIFLEPTRINVVAKNSLKANFVTGSPAHADFSNLMKQQQSYADRLNPLYDAYTQYRTKDDKEGMKKTEDSIDAINNEISENIYGAFLKNHSKSPVALYALKQYAGYDIDPDKIEPLFASLPANMQKWPSAVSFKNRINIAKMTVIGKKAMDFTQNDTSGHPVSLSSFKGKYVLVDFWASWCGPCRRENPNVVKAFNKFKDKNFTILGVSLDKPDAKEKWMKAIHDDGLTWNHVSDLKFWDNEVAKEYGIRAIPQNFLVNPQGKIIAKNLSGEELDKKLEEVLIK